MKPTIECLYSCDGCGLKDAKVHVPQRNDNEAVKLWFDQVLGPAIARDHSGRSPLCTSGTMKDLKIPVEGAEYIGGPTTRRVN